MKHKVDALNSTILHSSDELKTCVSKMASREDSSSKIYCLYHNPHDESYALGDAIKEQKSDKFVTFDNNAAIEVLSKKTREKIASAPNKSQTALFGGGILGALLFSGLIPTVLSVINDKWKIILACVFAVLLAGCVAVSLFVGLARKSSRSRIANKLSADCLKTLDVKKLERRDFCYSYAKNRIFVVKEPCCGTDDDTVWQCFLRYAQCKPSKAPLNVLLLKTVRVKIGDKHASEVLGQTFENEKIFWKKNNFDVADGGYLVPLTELEKIKLVEELGLGKKIPNGFLSYGGRDYFYGFEEDGYMSLEDYGAEVDNIYAKIQEEFSLQTVSKDGVRKSLSFLAALQLFLGGSKVDNVSDVLDLPENAGIDEYFCQILQPSAPTDKEICRRILQMVWSDFDKMPLVVKREYVLLSTENQHADNLPVLSYQKAVLCAIGFLKYKNENFYIYEDMETDVNGFWDKIFYWYGKHTSLRIKNVSDNWLEILSYLLEINSSCGYFARNCSLLYTLDVLYKESLTVSDNAKFMQFYVSPTVKKAHEVNALVCPHCKIDGKTVNAQKMHLDYLENVAAIQSLSAQSVDVEQSFEFMCNFEYSTVSEKDSSALTQRYRDLLAANKGSRLPAVFNAIYSNCMQLCEKRTVVLKLFSQRCEYVDASEEIATALGKVNADSYLYDVLYGEDDRARLLSCGLADCDLFYLLYDFDCGEESLVFDNEIESPSYRFAARFFYLEKNGKYFSNVFNEVVDDAVMRAHNQFTEKYFIDCLQYNMLSITKQKIVSYLSESSFKAEYDRLDTLSAADTEKLMEALFALYQNVPECKMLGGAENIRCEQGAEKAWQYFCGIVLDKQPVAAEKTEEFVDDVAAFSADTAYLLFTQACDLDENLARFIPKVYLKLLSSRYINKCVFVLRHIESVPNSEKQRLLSTVRAIITAETKAGVLPKNTSVLLQYVSFMRRYGSNAEDLELTLMRVYKEIADMEQEGLRRNAGYLLHYAYNMINAVRLTCALSSASQFEGNLTVSELKESRRSLKIFVTRDNAKWLGNEFVELIGATLNNEAEWSDTELAEFYNQIIDGLLELFDTEYVRTKIPEIINQTLLLKQLRKHTVMSK
ncbi:MAG: hypothetical protein NC132_03005 [Corallococcus sp.]|nr:hypothetical protein [Corallococcus sp.]MCM1359078.1 hypothetical protein [Corallococcus sp.]MCM1395067.1 hypothetical protein [Corallococcus sp.]